MDLAKDRRGRIASAAGEKLARRVSPVHWEPSGKHAAWVALLIVLLTITAYAPALSGGFIWDDDNYVTENLMLRSPDGLWRIWTQLGAVPQYYPFVHTTFWVEYHLWGVHPLGYHLLNVLLHALNSILRWRVLRALGVPAPGSLAPSSRSTRSTWNRLPGSPRGRTCSRERSTSFRSWPICASAL